jgi:hypothetical protein
MEEVPTSPKLTYLVMERVVWHILYLQLLPVIIFNKHIVAHAHEGVAVYQFYLMEFALVTISGVT